MNEIEGARTEKDSCNSIEMPEFNYPRSDWSQSQCSSMGEWGEEEEEEDINSYFLDRMRL